MSKLQTEKRENGPWAFEHGQLWITSNSWASWSVTDCEKAGEFYFGFEQVS